MNCYYHQDSFSVGVCRNCFKGLCSNCAVDIENGLACRDKCEEQARSIVQYLKKSMSSADSYRKIYANSNKDLSLGSVFVIGVGLTYVLFPWFYGESDGTWFYLLGSIFVLAGLFLAVRHRKLRSLYKQLSEKEE